MLTNREMVNFKKLDFFDFSLYFYYKLCHCRSMKKAYWVYDLLFYSQQYITIISSRKMCGFISSVLKKTIPNNTSPTFQEVGGVTQPRIFCWLHKNFSWYRVNHHKIDWFLLSRCFYFFVCPYFQLKLARTSTHSEIHSAHVKILRVIVPLFWCTKFLLVSIQRA